MWASLVFSGFEIQTMLFNGNVKNTEQFEYECVWKMSIAYRICFMQFKWVETNACVCEC